MIGTGGKFVWHFTTPISGSDGAKCTVEFTYGRPWDQSTNSSKMVGFTLL